MGLIDAPLYNSRVHPWHPIQLTSVNKPFTCDGCYQPGFGFCYRCIEPSGRFGCIFHEGCVHPEEYTWNPLSNGCRFTYIFSRPNSAPWRQNTALTDTSQIRLKTFNRICDVCCTEITGSYYACCQHKPPKHFIHPACIKMDNSVRFSTVQPTGLHLELKGTTPNKCGLCGHREAFKGMKGWSYVSSCGGLCLHVKCFRQMFIDSWKRMNLGRYSNRSCTPEMTITLMSRRMIAGAPSDGPATIYGPGRGQELVVYRGRTTFSTEYAAAGFMALLKLAFPFLASWVFGLLGVPLC